jgi:ribosomal protein S18 acetylase RimI-like enzyme
VEPLDNPAWHALCGPHATLAEGSGGARRYRPEYTIFAALDDDTDDDSWHALTRIAGPGDATFLLRGAEPRAGWRLLRSFPVHQMVLDRAPDDDGRPDTAGVEPLDESDAARMAALVATTEPGPWAARTHELGTFVGVRVDGRIVAMAGQRMRLPDAIEISAVCTDPEFRGRGLARAAVTAVVTHTVDAGCLPFLHVHGDNTTAIRLYEDLGFRTRTMLRPGVYQAPSD